MICQENENPNDSLPDYVSHVSATKKIKTQIRVTNSSDGIARIFYSQEPLVLLTFL